MKVDIDICYVNRINKALNAGADVKVNGEQIKHVGKFSAITTDGEAVEINLEYLAREMKIRGLLK